MKRIGYIYEKIYDKENLRTAIYKAAKGKSDKRNIKFILDNIDKFIDRLHEDLKNETYKLSENRIKYIKDGPRQKERIITVPAFYPDQVIHWALTLQIQKVMSKGMYYYNCGSVPGKGALFAKNYVERVLKTNPKYALKIDIKKFFPSISNEKMKQLFKRKIKDDKVLRLIDAIIDNGGKGLPIGYYTSQWFSNFYLEELDHFIKEVIKIPYYVRYVDDMILFSNNKRQLHQTKNMIEEFLTGYEYRLKIKNNWQVFQVSKRPIDFVGYQMSPGFTKLRKHIFIRLNRCSNRLSKKITLKNARSLVSMMGWMIHTSNGKRYIEKYIEPLSNTTNLKKYIGRIQKHENNRISARADRTSSNSCQSRINSFHPQEYQSSRAT